MKRSGPKFNQVSLDQRQDRLNATAKKGSGVIGYNNRSRIAVQTSDMLGKENSKERQKVDNKTEDALYRTLKKFGVFISQGIVSLQNITTKDLASEKIVQSLVNTHSLGLNEFVEQRLIPVQRRQNEIRKSVSMYNSVILFARTIQRRLSACMK